MGYRLLQKLAEELIDVAVVEFAPKQEGRNMTMVLGPAKKSGSAKKAASAKSK
jgi:translation initiation factor IF-3